MNVLITGGAGFIGSTLADKLVDRGDKVTILDNLETGRESNINRGARFVEGSVANPFALRELFAKTAFDIVVHAAASYKNPNDWHTDVMTNCLGSVSLMQEAKEHNVKRFIYFQTSCAYGHAPTQSPITPEYPLTPDTSSYAVSKATAEFYLRISGLPYISFRLANSCGPRNCTGPLPEFYKRLSVGKACFVTDTRRDFIDVEDLCAVVIRAIDGEGKTGAYNISTGKDYAIRELYDLVAAELGVTEVPELRPRGDDDTYTLLIDPSKTEQDFPGWKAATPLATTVKNAIAWYKTAGDLTTYTHLRMKK